MSCCCISGKSQLAQHRKIHKDRMCVCSSCGKKFTTKHHLRRHEVIHTNKKDYACPHCAYRCNVFSNLRKHCLFVHKVDHARKKSRVIRFAQNGEPVSEETPEVIQKAAKGDVLTGEAIPEDKIAVSMTYSDGTLSSQIVSALTGIPCEDQTAQELEEVTTASMALAQMQQRQHEQQHDSAEIYAPCTAAAGDEVQFNTDGEITTHKVNSTTYYGSRVSLEQTISAAQVGSSDQTDETPIYLVIPEGQDAVAEEISITADCKVEENIPQVTYYQVEVSPE